jgi:hypothetical protein
MVLQDLDFLATDYGFMRVGDCLTGEYRHDKLSISTSNNERDGYETDLAYHQDGGSHIALGTLLAALDVSNPGHPATHAAFLRSNLTKFLGAPRDIHDDMLALRFWHASRWRSDWGRGIKLDSDSIESETARLMRLRSYFVGQQ